MSKRVRLQFHGANPEIDELHAGMTSEKRSELLAHNDREPWGIISVSSGFSDRTREGSFLDQHLGVASSSPLDGFDSLPVPESDWAVFPSRGRYPDALQETWAAIYAKWLGGSGYNLTGGPEMLWNESDDTARDDFLSEIWIPVRKM